MVFFILVIISFLAIAGGIATGMQDIKDKKLKQQRYNEELIYRQKVLDNMNNNKA